jgi:hypothetical protein
MAAGCHYRQVRILLAGLGLWAPSMRSLSNHHSVHVRRDAQLERVCIEEVVARSLAATARLLQSAHAADDCPLLIAPFGNSRRSEVSRYVSCSK